jgi:predicted metalloendopeptidase
LFQNKLLSCFAGKEEMNSMVFFVVSSVCCMAHIKNVNAMKNNPFTSAIQGMNKSYQGVLDENARFKEDLDKLRSDLSALREENAKLSSSVAAANQMQEELLQKPAESLSYTVGYAIAKLIEAESHQFYIPSLKILFHKYSNQPATLQSMFLEHLRKIAKLPENSLQKRMNKAAKLAEFSKTIEQYERNNPYIRDIVLKIDRCLISNYYCKFKNPMQFDGRTGTKIRFPFVEHALHHK